MENKPLVRKNRRFLFNNSCLDILDWGYNDFRYIEPCTTPRYLSHYSIHFVRNGCGTLNVNGKSYKISGKTVFCLTPNALISYYPDDNDPWSYFWINYNGHEAKSLTLSMGFNELVPLKKAINCENVYTLLESLLYSNCSQKEFYLELKSILYSVASRLCQDDGAESFVKNSNIVSRAIEILHLNYKNVDFSIEVLADILHVSHSYICRLFKKETGQTIIKYLVELRLKKARELLEQNDYLVKELATAVGFNDELHFMKEFKNKYGATVKQYRKNLISQ